MSTLRVNNISNTSGVNNIVNNSGTLEIYGSSGVKAMSILSNGLINFPTKPVFVAYSTHSALGATNTIPYSNAVINVGNHYNTSTYRFTAPVAGMYLFSVYDIGTTNTTSRIQLMKNGSTTMGISTHQIRMPSGGDYASGLSFWIVSAQQNDYFYAQIYAGSSYGTPEYAWFQGFMIG